MKRHISCGLSLPIEFMRVINRERQDVSRSRYLLRLLEKAYRNEKQSTEVLS